MAESKKMFLSYLACDFIDKESNANVKGYSIRYLYKHNKTGEIKYDREWIPDDYVTDSIKSSCKTLIPGQEFVFDYALDGRKIYVSDIIPGEMIFDIQNKL